MEDSGPVAESQVGRQEEDSLSFSLPKILEKACCPLEKSLDLLAQVENQHKVTSESSTVRLHMDGRSQSFHSSTSTQEGSCGHGVMGRKSF